MAELTAWITEAGLAGHDEISTLTGFCERAVAFGLPLARAIILADTLHPMYQGRAFRWNRDKETTVLTEYGRTEEDLGRWMRSPFFYLEESGETMIRRRLTSESQGEFSIFPELVASGMTDYVAIVNRFATEATIGNMDGVDELRLAPDGHTLYFTTGQVVAPAYPKSLEDSERGLQQMQSWNNGRDNIWKVDLAPWLSRHRQAPNQ